MTESTGKRDLAGAVGVALLIVVGALALAASAEFSKLGAVFPRAIGASLIALGLAYLAMFALGRTPRSARIAGSNLRRGAVAVVMLCWAFALAPLGFIASSIGGVTALLVIANHNRWTPRTVFVYGASAALVLAALYLLFAELLKIPLP
jgi:hypothetical protein